MKIKDCLLSVLAAAIGIMGLTALFNYAVDPYYIFRHASISGFNDKKPCLYYNREHTILSDMQLNSDYKTDAFIGGNYLYRDKTVPYNIAFYTISGADTVDIRDISERIIVFNPYIKRLYLGVNFNDIFEKDRSGIDYPGILTSYAKCTPRLLLSFDMLKDSIETVKTSFASIFNSTDYVYPYQELAFRTYSRHSASDYLQKIKSIKDFTLSHGINLIIYFPPSDVSYKIHLYEKGFIDEYIQFKKDLAEISPFYDYSLNNEFNMEILDGTGVYYRDSVHITDELNSMIVKDIISGNFEIGVLINKKNVKAVTERDLELLENYMKANPDIVNKIKNVKPEDAPVKIKRGYTPYSRALL